MRSFLVLGGSLNEFSRIIQNYFPCYLKNKKNQFKKRVKLKFWQIYFVSNQQASKPRNS